MLPKVRSSKNRSRSQHALILRRSNTTAPYFSSLDRTGLLAVCISGGIYVTTQQAQDFKDVHGDRAIGRRTLPIIFPSIARYTMTVPMVLWSVCLVSVWNLDPITSSAFLLLSIFVGVRFLTHTTIKDDKISFWWYNVRVFVDPLLCMC